MKSKHLALPIVALAMAGILLGLQRKSVSDLRVENVELRERIAAARVADTSSDLSRPDRPDASGEPIDWDKLVTFYREHPDGNAPGMLSIQRRLLAMDPVELLAELDRIDAMDLEDETRDKLELLILDPLCRKDPQAALDRFKGRLGDNAGMHEFLLSNALKDWAKKDGVAANSWLDREAESGTFESKALDGKNRVKTRFESAVVFGLFAADPAKAEARLSNLPPSLRADILSQADGFHKMGAQDEIALAEIVRRQLDESGRVTAISKRAGKVIGRGGDFAVVDEYLNSVYAAPDERESSAEAAARRYTDSLASKGEMSVWKLEAMRTWVGRDAPGSVDRLTGEALGTAVNSTAGMDFVEAASLALRYRESSGKDEVLQQFLSSLHPGPNNAEARKLAEKITHPISRDRLLRKFE
jgi:hypothetical protein